MRLFFFLALLCLAPAALCQTDAYQARVAVGDQSAAAREPALREALGSVLVRVSGEPAAAGAQDILTRAGQLVQRYGYERDPDGSLRLVAAFDPRAVDAALKANGLPVFGVHAGEVADVQLAVTGVRDARDYARTIAALRGLPGVKSVAVVEAAGELLQLRVRAEGGAGRLAGAISIGGVLLRDDSAPGRMVFQLAPG